MTFELIGGPKDGDFVDIAPSGWPYFKLVMVPRQSMLTNAKELDLRMPDYFEGIYEPKCSRDYDRRLMRWQGWK